MVTAVESVAQAGEALKKPGAGVASPSPLQYMRGFGNAFESEAVPGVLPSAQNTPQRVAGGLYAEQLSGTAFTAPRATNQRTWMYRIEPSVVHAKHRRRTQPRVQADFTAGNSSVAVDQLRWRAPEVPAADGERVDWVDGLVTMCGAGSAEAKEGIAVHLYAFNASMSAADRAFSNADGDLLIVPQSGDLLVTTELGRLSVRVGEIAVVPRNIAFAVDHDDADAAAAHGGASAADRIGTRRPGGGCRGYVLESFASAHFRLPDLGPIGANGLAEPRDFEYPCAWFEDRACDFTVTTKVLGELFDRPRAHSAFDVVAWRGNYAPYKYDLSKFVTVNSVSVDHLDPSIFTVLTIPSAEPGVAAIDFVIFPPRWMCAERTFRPPYYHRNCMSEFMGLIDGGYDAKVGFVPGGSSLHGIGVPHGPDAATFEAATRADTSTPTKFTAGTAFMFETRCHLRLTAFAADDSEAGLQDTAYAECWQGLRRATLDV